MLSCWSGQDRRRVRVSVRIRRKAQCPLQWPGCAPGLLTRCVNKAGNLPFSLVQLLLPSVPQLRFWAPTDSHIAPSPPQTGCFHVLELDLCLFTSASFLSSSLVFAASSPMFQLLDHTSLLGINEQKKRWFLQVIKFLLGGRCYARHWDSQNTLPLSLPCWVRSRRAEV